jgi:hypothetical protein
VQDEAAVPKPPPKRAPGRPRLPAAQRPERHNVLLLPALVSRIRKIQRQDARPSFQNTLVFLMTQAIEAYEQQRAITKK